MADEKKDDENFSCWYGRCVAYKLFHYHVLTKKNEKREEKKR